MLIMTMNIHGKLISGVPFAIIVDFCSVSCCIIVPVLVVASISDQLTAG